MIKPKMQQERDLRLELFDFLVSRMSVKDIRLYLRDKAVPQSQDRFSKV